MQQLLTLQQSATHTCAQVEAQSLLQLLMVMVSAVVLVTQPDSNSALAGARLCNIMAQLQWLCKFDVPQHGVDYGAGACAALYAHVASLKRAGKCQWSDVHPLTVSEVVVAS